MRIRWIALFAAGATVAALAASSVSAASARVSAALYDVSLTGSQRSVVTRNGTGTDRLGCTVRYADRDRQTIAFASRRRVALKAFDRIPFLRFGLVARVTGSLHRESRSVGGGENCVSAPIDTTRTCGPLRLPARLVLHPGPRWRAWLDGGFVRPRDRTRCATTLVAPDAFIQSSETRLDQSPARAARVFLHGHLVARLTTGHLITQTTTVDWRIVLARIA